MSRAIITVVGKDTVGIIAGICGYLATNNVNILDISQTIVKGYFNMMMIVDITSINKQYGDVVRDIEEVGKNMGVVVKCQKEEIFNQMHRI